MSKKTKRVNSEEVNQVEETPETQEGLIAWVKSNKRQLALAGVSVTAVIGIILGLRNKDACLDLWTSLSERVTKASVEMPAPGSIVKETIPVLEAGISKRSYTLPTEAFDVSRHIRTMAEGWHHSSEKAIEAMELGIDLLPNQTIVGPYTKGAA